MIIIDYTDYIKSAAAVVCPRNDIKHNFYVKEKQ